MRLTAKNGGNGGRYRVLGYLHARRRDLLGTLDGHRRMAALVNGLIAAIAERRGGDSSSAGPATWEEAVTCYGYTAAGLRHRYQSWATVARVLLGAAGIGGLVLVHRLSLGDWGGAFASLGAVLALIAFALQPAYRCWLIRTRTLGASRAFLRQPARWWPPALPADYDSGS